MIKKIISNAKINLSLLVLKKLNNGLHAIETLVVFLDLHDEIYIKTIKTKNHKIKFYGSFSKGIKKINTVSKLLNMLDKKNLLKSKKYQISIKKNIPQKSGLGGGSMNASAILSYFINSKIISVKKKEIHSICHQIGSDVIFGMDRRPQVMTKNNIIRYQKKMKNLNFVLTKPNFGCSTKDIYKNINLYSKPVFTSKLIDYLKTSKVKKLRNDLEKIVYEKYPRLLKLKKYLNTIPKANYTKMTGSGSCLFLNFDLKKDALDATKKIKKRYKKNWCIFTKTI